MGTDLRRGAEKGAGRSRGGGDGGEWLTERQRRARQNTEKREDELEHNNSADSKELILLQASMEARY